MTCDRDGCNNAAEFAIAVQVPAKGHQFAPRSTKTAIPDLKLCRACAGVVTDETTLDDAWRETITASMARDGMEPAFTRARMTPVRLEKLDAYKAALERRNL
ncbi:hypothetical protein [Microbaculum marinum]|uniref:Uncharacterized protein n=1 Tax=Microbaculum marinum TaxID=1764581 RepID=A0AAW9RG45_9HYPH